MRKTKGSHRGKAVGHKTEKKQSKSVQSRVRDQSPDPGTPEKKRRAGQFVPGDPRINRTKPGPGRPPGKFARKCRRVLNNKNTWRAVRRTLKNENSPHFKGMWAEVANRGHGRQNAGIGLINPGGEDGEGGNEPVNALALLVVKLDQMADRTEKAKKHLKEA